jgi:hypothetical protein
MLVVIGNSKMGKVLHVNLPRGAPKGYGLNSFLQGTCPGASEWCLANCYGVDRPPSEDPRSLEAVRNTIESLIRDMREFKRKVVEELLEKARILSEEGGVLESGEIPVRLHVIYHADYARTWLDIVDELKGYRFRFWTYTRSWWIERVAEVYKRIGLSNPQGEAETLFEVLQGLRRRSNFVLYASTDKTMPDITMREEMKGWLEAGIEFTYNKGSRVCPEIPCVVCKYCIYGRGHVRFIERRKIRELGGKPWGIISVKEWRELVAREDVRGYVVKLSKLLKSTNSV